MPIVMQKHTFGANSLDTLRTEVFNGLVEVNLAKLLLPEIRSLLMLLLHNIYFGGVAEKSRWLYSIDWGFSVSH